MPEHDEDFTEWLWASLLVDGTRRLAADERIWLGEWVRRKSAQQRLGLAPHALAEATHVLDLAAELLATGHPNQGAALARLSLPAFELNGDDTVTPTYRLRIVALAAQVGLLDTPRHAGCPEAVARLITIAKRSAAGSVVDIALAARPVHDVVGLLRSRDCGPEADVLAHWLAAALNCTPKSNASEKGEKHE